MESRPRNNNTRKYANPKTTVAASLCMAFILFSAVPYIATADSTLIHDNHGHTWAATGTNLVAAFNALQTNSELWIPAGTYYITNGNLAITKNGVKIHGAGPSTVISFSNGARLISGQYASATTDSVRYRYGVNNLLLENFKITGKGCIELVLGDNTKLQGITATKITACRPAAFRFILPTNDHSCTGLQVIDCHTSQTWAHGFQINAVQPNGYNTLSNVLFDNCSASWAGFLPTGRPSGNSWSVGFDLGEGYSQCALSTPSTTVRDCRADHNWECGFHMESVVQRSLTFIHCQADYNGQKRVYSHPSKYYCSGFVAENGVSLYNCEASYNTNYGVLSRNHPIISGLSGTGNWEGLRKG